MTRAVVILLLGFAIAGCASAVQRPADLTELGVADASRLIREGKVTSVELTRAYITRADANADLNVYITLDRAGSMAAAQRAERIKGSSPGRH